VPIGERRDAQVRQPLKLPSFGAALACGLDANDVLDRHSSFLSQLSDEVREKRPQVVNGWDIHKQRYVPLNVSGADLKPNVKKQNQSLGSFPS